MDFYKNRDFINFAERLKISKIAEVGLLFSGEEISSKGYFPVYARFSIDETDSTFLAKNKKPIFFNVAEDDWGVVNEIYVKCSGVTLIKKLDMGPIKIRNGDTISFQKGAITINIMI